MTEEVAKYEVGRLQDFDPFRAMDKLDDELFLEEMKGRIVDTWAYSFRQDGKDVNGLSKVGVDQACREMAKSGEVIREENVEYTIDPTDKRYILFKGFASRIAVAKDGREVVLDRTIGTKRQCVFIATKEKGITDKVNPFWYEQGAMKSLRNARMRLLSEEIKTKIIVFSKENKKVREVKPEDDTTPPVEKGTSRKSSKDTLFDELSSYCQDAEGLVDGNMRDSIVSQIATKKDGTPIKSWEELDKIDGVKYEKWFASMLKKFRER